MEGVEVSEVGGAGDIVATESGVRDSPMLGKVGAVGEATSGEGLHATEPAKTSDSTQKQPRKRPTSMTAEPRTDGKRATRVIPTIIAHPQY